MIVSRCNHMGLVLAQGVWKAFALLKSLEILDLGSRINKRLSDRGGYQ